MAWGESFLSGLADNSSLLKALGLMTAGTGAAAYAMSPDDAEAARLFHGTTIEGLRGIRKSGKINGPAYFTPEIQIAEDYARGGPIVSVEVPDNKLNIDYESKNWGDFLDEDTGEDSVSNALRNSAAVYTSEDVPIGGGKFYYRDKVGYFPTVLGVSGVGAYGLMAPDNAEASVSSALTKDLASDAERSLSNDAGRGAAASSRDWAKDAGNNTPNIAQALTPNDPLPPSSSQLAATAALITALKSKDQPLEDTYQPGDLFAAFMTGGAGLAPKLASAALDPVISAGMDYAPGILDAINPRNIIVGLMR